MYSLDNVGRNTIAIVLAGGGKVSQSHQMPEDKSRIQA